MQKHTLTRQFEPATRVVGELARQELYRTALLTVREVAAFLRLHEKTIYDLVERGAIPHLRLGRCVRFSLEDVIRWLGSRKEGV